MTTVVLDQLREVTVTDEGPTTLVTVSQTGMQGPQGNPTTVNGHTGASITLTASDVGALASSARGAVNGVAELDSSGLVPMSELNLSSLATDFMDLSTDQTVGSGVKTFTASPVVPTPTTSTAAANKSYVDAETTRAEGVEAGLLPLSGGTMTGILSMFNHRITSLAAGSLSSDAVNVSQLPVAATTGTLGLVQMAGDLGAGTGTSPQVTGTHLASPLPVAQGGTGSATQSFVDLSSNQSGVGGSKTFTAKTTVSGSSSTGMLAVTNTTAVTGAAAADVTLTESGSTSQALGALVSGDTNLRVKILATGEIDWGPGNAATDTQLLRAAAGVLATGKNLLIGATAALGDNGVGEIQLANVTTTPTTNPTGGGVLYAASGRPNWRDSGGLVVPVLGTVSCTSTTHPASPFVGMEIIETDTLASAMWNGTSWIYNATQVGTVILGTAAASMGFGSAVIGKFNNYFGVFCVRQSTGSGGAYCFLQINTDTGNHYTYQATIGNGTSITTSNSGLTTGFNVGVAPGSGDTANYFGTGEFTIANAQSTTGNKPIRANGGAAITSTNAYTGQWVGQWNSATAITDIHLWPNAGNFVAGSSFTLYGYM